MNSTAADANLRPPPDRELVDVARYVAHAALHSREAYDTARYCLMDALGVRISGIAFPRLHPAPGTDRAGHGRARRRPRARHELRARSGKAAFDIGTMVRWLDFNDTWLAAEWGHPSDNLGGILATADWVSRNKAARGESPLVVRDVLTAMIKAHEIQGVAALENSFNRVGLDHVVLVKVASAAVVTHILGGTEGQIIDALSHAWVDGQSLRTYRHAPNTSLRKSWAAGDATSRAVRLALMVLKGEPGLPSVLSAPKWGFCDVSFKGDKLRFPAPVWLVRHGARAVQDFVSRRVPRPDGRRMRGAVAPAGQRPARGDRTHRAADPGARPSGSSARLARCTTRPTAITVFNIW